MSLFWYGGFFNQTSDFQDFRALTSWEDVNI